MDDLKTQILVFFFIFTLQTLSSTLIVHHSYTSYFVLLSCMRYKSICDLVGKYQTIGLLNVEPFWYVEEHNLNLPYLIILVL